MASEGEESLCRFANEESDSEPDERDYVVKCYRFPNFSALTQGNLVVREASFSLESFGVVPGIGELGRDANSNLWCEMMRVSKLPASPVDPFRSAPEITEFEPSPAFLQRLNRSLHHLQRGLNFQGELTLQFRNISLYENGRFQVPQVGDLNSHLMTLMVLVPGDFGSRNGGVFLAEGQKVTWALQRTDILFFNQVRPEVIVGSRSSRVALFFDVIGSRVESDEVSDYDNFISGMKQLYERGHRCVGFLADYNGPTLTKSSQFTPSALKEAHETMFNAMLSSSKQVEIVEVSLWQGKIYTKTTMDHMMDQNGRFKAVDSDIIHRSDWLLHLNGCFEYDSYEDLEEDDLYSPSLTDDSNKLREVVFLTSDNRLHVSASTRSSFYWKDGDVELHQAFAVIARLSVEAKPKSAQKNTWN